MSKVLELFGISTSEQEVDWRERIDRQNCPYLHRTCLKVRKSQPEVSIGTCSVSYGLGGNPVLICPHRLLERKQIFIDCLHLLNTHEPGNELHIVPEVSVPGGSVDYFLVSVKNRKVKDFVGIELQTLDTTGTVWPERERFLKRSGLAVDESAVASKKRFGMNWKMTAKTILVQLHHKIETFEEMNKHLVLVIQDVLLDYMRREFRFDNLNTARLGEPMHIHSYTAMMQPEQPLRIELDSRWSTDTAGIAACLGLQAEAKLGLQQIVRILETKISDETIFVLQ